MAASMTRLCKFINYSNIRPKQGIGCIKSLYKSSFTEHLNTRHFSTRYKDRFFNKRPLLTKCIGVSASIGVFTFCYTRGNAQDKMIHAETGQRPQHKPIRSIKSDTDHSSLKLTLYQYQTCPFCCKVRAFLDFHGFSYDVVEVNSVWRTQLKWTKYPKVPIVVCDLPDKSFVQMNDSSVIISVLQTLLVEGTNNGSLEQILTYYPEIESKGKRGKIVYDYPNRYFIMYGEKTPDKAMSELKEEREWRKWVDSWLVHTLSPNVYRTPSEALQAFNYFSEVGEWNKVFSSTERTVVIYVGALAMYALGKLLKRKYSLKEDVRESLYDACDEWVDGIGVNRPYMGGNQPNLADLSVYGSLSSIEGCTSFKDLLEHTKIRTWYYNMKKLVTSHQGAQRMIDSAKK